LQHDITSTPEWWDNTGNTAVEEADHLVNKRKSCVLQCDLDTILFLHLSEPNARQYWQLKQEPASLFGKQHHCITIF
jgi:hypothetical protein